MLSLPIADEPLPRPGKLLRIIGQKNPYSFNKGCIKGGMPVFGRQKKADKSRAWDEKMAPASLDLLAGAKGIVTFADTLFL